LSILHYKKGTEKDPAIDGLHCEIRRIDPTYSIQPEKGWHMSPEEAHGIKKEITEEKYKVSENETEEKTGKKEVLKNTIVSAMELNQEKMNDFFEPEIDSLDENKAFEDMVIPEEKVLTPEDEADSCEPKVDETAGLETPQPRTRKQFKCKGCGKRKNRFEDTIVLNYSGDRFCSEKCKKNYKE
jgi:hypothetical protein